MRELTDHLYCTGCDEYWSVPQRIDPEDKSRKCSIDANHLVVLGSKASQYKTSRKPHVGLPRSETILKGQEWYLEPFPLTDPSQVLSFEELQIHRAGEPPKF